MSDKLKSWAHWASLNPIDDDQKEMADDVKNLIERIACLEQELEDAKADSKRFKDLLDAAVKALRKIEFETRILESSTLGKIAID